jgi:hypothetical protein
MQAQGPFRVNRVGSVSKSRPLIPQSRPMRGHSRSAAWCRYCCKSRFALGVGNSAGCRCGFRVKMRGASSPHVKLTSDFANTREAIRIGDCFVFDSFAKNSSPSNFRLLQHNLPIPDISSIARGNGTYPPLPWRTHSAHVGRSISKRSESFAYHFAPCMPPISFSSGVSTIPRAWSRTNRSCTWA